MEKFYQSALLFLSVVYLAASSHHVSKPAHGYGASAARAARAGRAATADMDVTDFSIYYNLRTNQTIRQMMPRPWYHPGWPLRLPFVGEPCRCSDLRCVCCAGINITQLHFDRKACTALTFDPAEFMINIEVTMNGERVMANSISAKNPPPFCIPVPVPYLPPGLVDVCIRLYDISVQDQRLHVCMDMETRVDKAPVLVLHYDCMDMGAGGVGLSKPGAGGGGGGSSPQAVAATTSKPSAVSTSGEPEQQDSDVYDVVTETKTDTTEYPFKIAIKYI